MVHWVHNHLSVYQNEPNIAIYKLMSTYISEYVHILVKYIKNIYHLYILDNIYLPLHFQLYMKMYLFHYANLYPSQ